MMDQHVKNGILHDLYKKEALNLVVVDDIL